MVFSWWRKRRPGNTSPQQPRREVLFEVLEDRTLPSVATLQLVPVVPKTTTNSPTVTLALDSFQFGAQNPTTIASATGGAGAGKLRFDALDVTTSYNAESPLVFAQMARGGHYQTATLTETNSDGQPIAIWVLETVFVTDDTTTKNDAGLPVEELKFVFAAATEANSTQSTSWNQVQNRAKGPALPPELNLSALPAPATTNLTLQLVSFLNLPTINLALNTFAFGARNPVTIGGVAGGAGAGKLKFDPLDVTAEMSNASPALLKALATGSHYKTATLTETNSDGQPMAIWVLETVFVTSDTITSNQGGLPTEELKFVFAAATEANSTQSTSWNQLQNKAKGPTLPPELNLSALPAPVPTTATLQLVSTLDLPTIDLDLNTFQFGARNPVTIGSAISGAGKLKFDALDVTTELSTASPALLKALATGSHYKTATLTQSDASGQPLAVWVLETVFVTQDTITSTAEGLPGEELKFLFAAATEANSTQSTSWNQVQNRAKGPALPPELNFTPLPAPIATNLTLQLVSTLDLPTINLDLDTFQFGARNPVTIGSGRAGKLKFDALDVTTELSNASPALLKALATGSHYKTATLTEMNADRQPLAIWVLETVFATQDTITSNPEGLPTEELKFVFAAATEANSTQSTSWNQAQNKAKGPALPPELNFSPLPAPAATNLTLQLVSTLDAPTINLDLNTFQFGARNSATIVSAASGAGAGKLKFDALDVTAELSNASPALLKALATGSHYKTAMLIQTNADGQPVAVWILDTVFVTQDAISSNPEGLPTEELKFVFAAATEANSTQSASWNQVQNKAKGPLLPPDLSLSALPAPEATDLTLQLVSTLNLPTISLNLGSFQFGAQNPVTIGSLASGAGAGKLKFDPLDATAELSNASPALLKALATGSHYKTAMITETNTQGHPIAVWILGTVVVTSDTITSNDAGLPTEKLTFVFVSATEANSAQSTSWNQLQNKANGPALPPDLVLSPLVASPAP